MLKNYILYFIFFIFISCSNKEQKTENQLYGCLDSKIKERPIGSSEDFFNYIREMELYSIKNGYLSDSNIEGYLSLLENLYYKENQANQFTKNIDNDVPNDFSFNSGIIFSFYKDCHIGLGVNNNEYIKKLDKNLKIYDNLELKGFDDYESFLILINNTNFQSEKDRLMLFNSIRIFAYVKDQNH